MERLESGELLNQLFLALCGESIDEFKARVEKESDEKHKKESYEKRFLEKVVAIKKAIRLGKLSTSEISDLFEVSESFVQEVSKMK